MNKKLLLLLPLLLLLASCAAQKETGGETDAAETKGLTIALSSLTEEIAYIDCESEGVTMQLLARTDADGSPRLAYNTCQVCSGSPYAYFADKNGKLICQNCHNSFSYDAVGQDGYGCMPIALTDYTVEEDQITVSAETLAAMQNAFKNWKKGL